MSVVIVLLQAAFPSFIHCEIAVFQELGGIYIACLAKYVHFKMDNCHTDSLPRQQSMACLPFTYIGP